MAAGVAAAVLVLLAPVAALRALLLQVVAHHLSSNSSVGAVYDRARSQK